MQSVQKMPLLLTAMVVGPGAGVFSLPRTVGPGSDRSADRLDRVGGGASLLKRVFETLAERKPDQAGFGDDRWSLSVFGCRVLTAATRGRQTSALRSSYAGNPTVRSSTDVG